MDLTQGQEAVYLYGDPAYKYAFWVVSKVLDLYNL